ncbi:MAG: C-GCAxxG-C-C family protein [Planctomycetota bacterium]|jgi:C_GCAxxG_C_C family probable redox protein
MENIEREERAERAERAVACFAEGFNCAQAVFSAYAPPLGLDSEKAMHIAAPFGGGMGRTARTCGAATGALMAIGLGRKKMKDRNEVYDEARRFLEEFEGRNGSVKCSELIGCDISTPEGMKHARDENLFKTVCPPLIRSAVEILEEMLKE